MSTEVKKAILPWWDGSYKTIKMHLRSIAKLPYSSLTPKIVGRVYVLGFLQVLQSTGKVAGQEREGSSPGHTVLEDLKNELGFLQGKVTIYGAQLQTRSLGFSAGREGVAFHVDGQIVSSGTPEFLAALERVQKLGAFDISATFRGSSGVDMEFFTEHVGWIPKDLNLKRTATSTGMMSIGGSKMSGWGFTTRNAHLAMVSALYSIPSMDQNAGSTSYVLETQESEEGRAGFKPLRFELDGAGELELKRGRLQPQRGLFFSKKNEQGYDAGSVIQMAADEELGYIYKGTLRYKSGQGGWDLQSTQTIRCSLFKG